MNQSPEACALVEALVKMAQALHLEVVAEGVENDAQADRLAGLGCELLQGYLFGRPMPLEHLLEKLSARSVSR
jgi:EAL domain-containing protein (putative c-di-GMP-specific phosphodiesterase class I)